ncbi:type VII secretion system protein YukD [Actinomyces naeslundii str. Howell 279]|nr:type VII secretion system protein YukD [Actinomyces naeslundii str. Howell 279]
MIPYTRLTVISAQARAEVVMPSDEPVGAQLPELLSLLGTAQGTQLAPIQIVRSGGDILDLERSLVQQEVLDGEIVRIMTDDEVPPPTEVSDISGLLTDMTDAHPGRWNDLSRLLGAGVLLAVSAVAAAWAAPRGLIATVPSWGLLLPGLGTMLLAAFISQGRSISSRQIGALATFLAFGLLVPAIYTLATGPVSDRLLAVAASLTAVALAVLGRGNVGWAFGAMVGMGLYGVWIAFNMVAIAPLG